MSDYTRLKRLDDFTRLSTPEPVDIPAPVCPHGDQYVLRVLVRPKYTRRLSLPIWLGWLRESIEAAARVDAEQTGIRHSWCYVTVRHGIVRSATDDEWHFDGASFRSDTIPERNYCYADHSHMEYRLGAVDIPEGFDPLRYDLSDIAARRTEGRPVHRVPAGRWVRVLPTCLHRRPPHTTGTRRTFVRVSFIDVEIRDMNNTANPLLPAPAWGRDPVRTFRDRLSRWEDTCTDPAPAGVGDE